MSATPALTEPANDDAQACQREADTGYYRQVLHELIEIGTDLARILLHQAPAWIGRSRTAPSRRSSPRSAATSASAT